MSVNFVKNNKNDKIWWVDEPGVIGEFRFTFDKLHIFYLFRDYPFALTREQREIFNKENPYWVEFFKDRQTAD